MKITLLLIFSITSRAFACPVCDYGTRDTALFIIIFLVPFVSGMAFLCWSSWKSGAFKKTNVTNSVLLAENISLEEEEKK